jgi:hypothetical protein
MKVTYLLIIVAIAALLFVLYKDKNVETFERSVEEECSSCK